MCQMGPGQIPGLYAAEKSILPKEASPQQKARALELLAQKFMNAFYDVPGGHLTVSEVHRWILGKADEELGR